MRTTLTLDQDVAERAKAVTQKLNRPFKDIVNEALRLGLEQIGKPIKAKPYVTRPHQMGLRAGFNLDNIQELLAQAEGEDAR
jgi:hypothetical protein